MSKTTVELLIDPIGELATSEVRQTPARGKDMSCVARFKNSALAVAGGVVVAYGNREAVREQINVDATTRVIGAEGQVVTPGLVDPHTHLVFGGNRANEFLMRCQGKSYAEIANAGGGIVASMRATREASLQDLVQDGRKRLQRMLSSGTTTCEVKTGYGLDAQSELRMLEAILTLSEIQPVELLPTFMPAHAFPPGVDRDQYVRDVVDIMLPRARDLVDKAANGKKITVFNDVFCDEGYFTLEQTKTILQAGHGLGFIPRVHADEFVSLGATKFAAAIEAASADHLLGITDADIATIAASNTVAVLLPGTSFFLNLPDHAPARKMIDSGAAVALGTDFNPGSCHISSLPFIWGLACLKLKMTVEEALTALTVNSAHSLRVADRVGRLLPGMQADFVIYDAGSLEEIPYNLGWNPVLSVFKKGVSVWERSVG
jgi:imidazolonepropionase